MSTIEEGVWYQKTINGKQVWHFYPTKVPGCYPTEAKEQRDLGYPTHPKEIIWLSSKEVPAPDTKSVYETTVVLHAPDSTDQPQIPTPTSTTSQTPGGAGYHNNYTYNTYNTYNYAGPGLPQEAATKVEPEPEEAEGIRITKEEVKLDAMLHEQAQAIRQLQYLYTVDYGSGDVHGRRYASHRN